MESSTRSRRPLPPPLPRLIRLRREKVLRTLKTKMQTRNPEQANKSKKLWNEILS
jgi:hypothetical protein